MFIICFVGGVANPEPQANKSFLIQQFFKNVGEVWASSPHLRSKSNYTMKLQQKSKRKSEESQLPSKSEGCNEIQGFRGNCDSQGKLGMCPSLAEPDSGGIPRRLLLGKTVFRIRQKGVPPLFLPASVLQLHFLKLANSQFDCLYETSCKFGQGNGAIAARWQAKAGVEPPFAGCGRPFFLMA